MRLRLNFWSQAKKDKPVKVKKETLVQEARRNAAIILSRHIEALERKGADSAIVKNVKDRLKKINRGGVGGSLDAFYVWANNSGRFPSP